MGKIWSRLRADLKEYRIGLLALGLYYISTRLAFRAFCPMVILTGLPCPGCGLSRAVWFLLTGELLRSFQLHPMAGLWLLLFLYFVIERYLLGRGITKGIRVFLVLLSLATLFLYFYRIMTLFPNRPPMSYTGRNMMEKLIPGYRQRVLSFFRLYG